MTDRLEALLAETLGDVARTTRTDEAVMARLLTGMNPARDTRSRRPRTWVAAASIAVAVAVLAVVIAVVGRRLSNHPAPPVHTGPVPTASVTPTPTPTATSVVRPMLQRCVVQIPPAWLAQLQEVPPPSNSVIASSNGLTVLTMTASGDAITYSNVFDQHAAGALVLVRPDRTTHVVYSLPPLQNGDRVTTIESAQTDGRWVVFDLVDPAGARTGIRAVDLSSGTVRQIATAAAGVELSVPQLLNGAAYWGELQVNAPTGGHIYGYDLAAAHRTTIDSGEVVNPTVLGGALEWTRGRSVQWLGTPELPTGYTLNPVKPYPLVQSDSGAAWTDWDTSGSHPLPIVMVKLPNDATPRTAFRGSRAPDDAAHQPMPFAITSTYLIYTDGTDLLALDLHTGVAIQINPYEAGFVRAAAANGVLAIDTLGSKGGSHLALLHPSNLPEPHC